MAIHLLLARKSPLTFSLHSVGPGAQAISATRFRCRNQVIRWLGCSTKLEPTNVPLMTCLLHTKAILARKQGLILNVERLYCYHGQAI